MLEKGSLGISEGGWVKGKERVGGRGIRGGEEEG